MRNRSCSQKSKQTTRNLQSTEKGAQLNFASDIGQAIPRLITSLCLSNPENKIQKDQNDSN
jgi:hypothetical protein